MGYGFWSSPEMNSRDLIARIGVYDKLSLQWFYVGVLGMGIICIISCILLWPLIKHDQDLRQRLSHEQQSYEQDMALLKQREHWQQRYQAIISPSAKESSCEWSQGTNMDTIAVTFDQVKGCLDEWIRDHEHQISEITLYKKDNSRMLEVSHD